MRDIYPRLLSEKSLVAMHFDGDGGDDTTPSATTTIRAPPDRNRRTSMSNSMTFFRGNGSSSLSSSLSSLFSLGDAENADQLDGPAAALATASLKSKSSSSSALPFSSGLNRSIGSMVNSMFSWQVDEKDLVSSKHKSKLHVFMSLMDRKSADEEYTTPKKDKNDKDLSTHPRAPPSNDHLDVKNHSSRCPLCLNGMSAADRAHPAQCATAKCNFNFCLDCAERYITSSKDPYQKASDGSYQLKIFLRCPCCRSDLSSSIRDTVLLRHADIVEKKSDEVLQRWCQLTPSDLSEVDAMNSDPYIQEAVEMAKEREAIFLRDGATAQDLPFGPAVPTKKLRAGQPKKDDRTTTKPNRRHSFFYGLIREAKEVRENNMARKDRHRHSVPTNITSFSSWGSSANTA